jgi:hypothetical protein
MVTLETLTKWENELHNFGPVRMAGTQKTTDWENWLMDKFKGLGCTIQTDKFKLMSWEIDPDHDMSIQVIESPGKQSESLDVVSYYPFAGSTLEKTPISGTILFANESGISGALSLLAKTNSDTMSRSIVVIEMPIGSSLFNMIKIYPELYPSNDPIKYNAPASAAMMANGIMRMFENKARGIILCYTDITNEAARYNHLPFSEPHGKIPALWVGRDSMPILRRLSGRGIATLRLDAKLRPNSTATSFIATLPGNSDEVLFATTHTDGPNEVNENGALGLLSMATYFSSLSIEKRKRKMVFSLPTGHYSGGAITDTKTGSGRMAGTGGILSKFPELKNKMVGHVALEQMGAKEWFDVGNTYQATDKVAAQYWIPTTNTSTVIRKLFAAAIRGENLTYSRSALVQSGFAPGEGGSVRAMGNPGIGLMGAPSYFLTAHPKGVIDKWDANVMYNEVAVATKLFILMDRMPSTKLQGISDLNESDLL